MITWNESLSVKIASIDDQHKKLIGLINDFYANINQGSSKEKLFEMIKALKDYTIVHFSNEEKYMKQLNYPAYQTHKKEHDKFVASVQDFEDRYKTGKLLISVEVTNFIKEWITKHIMGTDKLYTDFFIKNGVR